MGKYNTNCKCCGRKMNGGTLCSDCKIKLPLVRQMQGMVKDAKERVDREQRIQDDLRKVRNNDR